VADAESVWFPAAPKFTVPVPALKTDPVPFHAVVLTAFSFRMLDPPFNAPVPEVRVITPVKVWVKAVPRFNVPPPVPIIVRAAPFTFPVNVAIPPLLDMVVRPVVLYPAIL